MEELTHKILSSDMKIFCQQNDNLYFLMQLDLKSLTKIEYLPFILIKNGLMYLDELKKLDPDFEKNFQQTINYFYIPIAENICYQNFLIIKKYLFPNSFSHHFLFNNDFRIISSIEFFFNDDLYIKLINLINNYSSNKKKLNIIKILLSQNHHLFFDLLNLTYKYKYKITNPYIYKMILKNNPDIKSLSKSSVNVPHLIIKNHHDEKSLKEICKLISIYDFTINFFHHPIQFDECRTINTSFLKYLPHIDFNENEIYTIIKRLIKKAYSLIPIFLNHFKISYLHYYDFVDDNFYKSSFNIKSLALVNSDESLKIIKIKIFLKKYIIKKNKNCYSNIKFKFYKVQNELLNYKANPNIPVLKYGSINYQNKFKENLIKQNPKLLFNFNQLNKNQYLLKPKIDGIKIIKDNYLTEYYPLTNQTFIYDIIEYKNAFDRFNQLDKIELIDNFSLLIEKINNYMLSITKNKEKTIIKKCWLISKNIIIQLFSEIDNLTLSDYLDGFIIQSIDDEELFKIKPKKLLSIDIKFYQKYFYSKENIKLNYHFDIDDDLNLEDNLIYRAYPINSNHYQVKEFRYDKIKANPINIIKKINFIIQNNLENNF